MPNSDQTQYPFRKINRVTRARRVRGDDGASRELRPNLRRGLVRSRYQDTDLSTPRR